MGILDFFKSLRQPQKPKTSLDQMLQGQSLSSPSLTGKKPATPAMPTTLTTIPPSNPSFASSVSAGQFGAPVMPQVSFGASTAVKTAPKPAPILPPVPPTATTGAPQAPKTYTTPSGAVINEKGDILTPPPTQASDSTTPQAPQGATSAPTVPSITPEAQKAVDSANLAYQESLKITPEELATQEDIDKLTESAKKAYENAQGQAIPMEFITGQLAAIERRATGLAEPLEKKLARLQASRTSSLEASKFALDRADKKLTAEREATKPVAGTSFYDPTTGKFIQAPEKETTKPVTVSAGTSLVDPTTGKEIYKAPDKVETKAPTTIETAQGIQQWDPATGTWKSTGFTKPASATSETKAVEKAETQAKGKTDAANNYALVNELLNNTSLSQISGLQNPFTIFTPGTQAQTAKNLYSQIKGILALDNRQKLKGSGAISDFESKTLEQAASSLGRNLSDAEFQKQLKKIRGTFATASGMEADVKVTSPSGEIIESTASRDEINQLIMEGNKVEYR